MHARPAMQPAAQCLPHAHSAAARSRRGPQGGADGPGHAGCEVLHMHRSDAHALPGLADEHLASLARRTAASLRDLDIGGHARVGDAGLAALAQCSRLTRVRLRGAAPGGRRTWARRL